jgi:hypothetical protein
MRMRPILYSPYQHSLASCFAQLQHATCQLHCRAGAIKFFISGSHTSEVTWLRGTT